MPRLTAILLLLCFALPQALPALAASVDAEAGLPACCRRIGKHHCAMSMAERDALSAGTQQAQSPRWQSPLERCPYCAAPIPSFHPLVLLPHNDQLLATMIFHRERGPAQADSWRRIARERARHKRGPPARLQLA